MIVDEKGTDKATVDRIKLELESLHGKGTGDFAFGFDPETGRVRVFGSLNEPSVDSLENAYPGLIEYVPSMLTETDWTNDSPPYWGGA